MKKERLEELATLFKDGLLEDDRESAIEYFIRECDMNIHELNYFGIELTSEEKDEWMDYLYYDIIDNRFHNVYPYKVNLLNKDGMPSKTTYLETYEECIQTLKKYIRKPITIWKWNSHLRKYERLQ